MQRIVIQSFASCGCPMITLETFKPEVFLDDHFRVATRMSATSEILPIMLSKDNVDAGCYVLLTTHIFASDVVL